MSGSDEPIEARETHADDSTDEGSKLAALAVSGGPPELVPAVEAALERNARDAIVLDLRGISDVTDFFLIASGDSDTHTRAIGDNILDRLRESDFRPVGSEGRSSGNWILLDYVSVIVHIFLPRVRDFYQIERLWGDAPVVRLS